MLRRLSSTLTILGILAAVVLYFYAAALYSTGTSLDPAHGGYQHFREYWCHLYDPVTYTNQPNPGRPAALACTCCLVAAILFFWFSASALFADRKAITLTARIAGSLAILFGALVFTPLHNLVITLACPVGFIAVLAICLGLALSRHWILFALGLLGVGVGFFDYLIWTLHYLHPQQPAIQRAAFALIFLWMLAAAFKVLMLPTDHCGPLNGE